MPKGLHVLLSAYACVPNAGTEPGNGWNWALHLAEAGVQVHVLTVTEGCEPIEAYRAQHPNPRISFSYVPVPPMFIHTTGRHYAYWQYAAVKVARELHRAAPFDLVHHVTYSSIHVPTRLWKLGLPTIFGPVGGGQITPRSFLPLFGKAVRGEYVRTAFTKVLPYSVWHRYWLRKMSLVLTTNMETLKLARAIGGKRVEPWFDAALPEQFFIETPRVFTPQTGPVRLLWIGRMVPRKALPLSLDVLAKTNSGATLTIVGSGLPNAEVHRMISDRGLEERVHWAGRRLDRDEVRRAYLEHDALLFASLRDSCPAQLLEAMGLGLPVIILDHHGARDLVPEGSGLRVPVTTPEQITCDLARAVDRFADLSAEARSAMGRIGWEFARTLSYRAGAALFVDLYQQLLAGSPTLTALPTSVRHMRTATVEAG